MGHTQEPTLLEPAPDNVVRQDILQSIPRAIHVLDKVTIGPSVANIQSPNDGGLLAFYGRGMFRQWENQHQPESGSHEGHRQVVIAHCNAPALQRCDRH